MTNHLETDDIKILFAGTIEDCPDFEQDSSSEYTELNRILDECGFSIKCTKAFPSAQQLEDTGILVIGINRNLSYDLDVEVIREYLELGGGILVIVDSLTMSPVFSDDKQAKSLTRLSELIDVNFLPHHNRRSTFVMDFQPHYLTANLDRLKVGDFAKLSTGKQSFPVAFSRITEQIVMAYSHVGNGRVFAVSDLDWLTNELVTSESNGHLLGNVCSWLMHKNPIDIANMDIPVSGIFSETIDISLRIHNPNPVKRAAVECLLESDADAGILEKLKTRTIPPGSGTDMHWKISPQVLGDQKLRLTIEIEQEETLYFDKLPKVECLAPGYFSLDIRDSSGKLQTSFKTGDHFYVEGSYHWPAEIDPPPHTLELITDKGLVERQHEGGVGIERWYLEATAPGNHQLLLLLVETGQTHPAQVSVRESYNDSLRHIEASYLYPLQAEISAKLGHVSRLFNDEAIEQQPLYFIAPKEFVSELYAGEAAVWLQGVLVSARREQWPNYELLDILLTYLAPTYIPNRGTFIPYEPELASHLALLHPERTSSLELNLVSTLETSRLSLRQNIATYLLHEKYGHGFFFTQTRLGQQLAQLHLFPEFEDVRKLIEESAFIVNEGFAAWMELAFLKELEQDIGQAYHARYILLIEQGASMFELALNSEYFTRFPPKTTSRYQEGFEYLDFISTWYNLRCAIRALMIATNIDFDLDLENSNGVIIDREQTKERVLNANIGDYRSQHRLEQIAHLLRNNKRKTVGMVQKRHCPIDCRSEQCPLEDYISNHLGWRV